MVHQLIQFFLSFGHLPAVLRVPSEACLKLAQHMDAFLPNNPEKDMGLRKLLEAKDCFVRALLVKEKKND